MTLGDGVGFDAMASRHASRKPSLILEEEMPGVSSNGLLGVSFEQLANRLIHQHFVEVSNLEAQLEAMKEVSNVQEASQNMSGMSGDSHFDQPPSPTQEGPMGRPRQVSVGGNSVDDPMNSKSASEKMLKFRRRGSQLSATKILCVFEEDQKKEEIEKRFETDFGKLLRANTRYQSDVSTPDGSEGSKEKLTCFEKLREWLQSNSYEFFMALVLCVNVFFMALEAQVAGLETGFIMSYHSYYVSLADWELCFLIADVFFTALFAIDVLIRICVLRGLFFMLWMNYIDVAVSITSVFEMMVTNVMTLPLNPVLFRLLRIGKLFRAIRMVHMTNMLASLHLLVKCLIASCNMLFWSFCLLTFLQCVAGLIIGTLCRGYLSDPTIEPSKREEVYMYYGTFTRTILTMFEILFANWGPPCHVLIENVNEWFAIFFLFYRCVLGFAVLNVVNAVFVQQTMKTASTDEELAFKQKEKDIALYTRKVKSLFQTMDQSGDGSINLEEFAKLVKSPKLKFWMSQLELEYHDLLSLFEFLDNGDGEITLMEFIEGAARLKGSAKALDIWRLETKVEVLFEHVLHRMETERFGFKSHEAGRISQNVQDVFNKSAFQHIKTTGYARTVSNE
ncbi:Sodium channel protein 60E (Drosophila ion channel 60) (Drosophila sodium channel 1) (Protein smell-impaired 60E) (Sodium channel 2) (DmNav2) [Durusdinium trenchii]|uniref:Sodium channel protein 60E (Drosophila ion channel 60) (Drosophila sodium channel 1) (Protein smell-impaired 60E) (Sodium channel 2) (DmNav2) n=1 Tax=Durusdinium trenchii TaxID=1381693 RepID=A0ABP0RKH7_9DINO